MVTLKLNFLPSKKKTNNTTSRSLSLSLSLSLSFDRRWKEWWKEWRNEGRSGEGHKTKDIFSFQSWMLTFFLIHQFKHFVPFFHFISREDRRKNDRNRGCYTHRHTYTHMRTHTHTHTHTHTLSHTYHHHNDTTGLIIINPPHPGTHYPHLPLPVDTPPTRRKRDVKETQKKVIKWSFKKNEEK